jgi:hypothetical protein
MENKDRQKFEDILRLLELKTSFLVTKEHHKFEHDMVVCVSPFQQDEITLLKDEALKLINIK